MRVLHVMIFSKVFYETDLWTEIGEFFDSAAAKPTVADENLVSFFGNPI
ncbi:MAG: hypothetical protein ISR87_00745 [Candidatus Marinimicrobia bacterium]|nr:hypothetical protein [Candidatus Neomarinimicrobiota bacterium]